MAHIPKSVIEMDPPVAELPLENQGKVRDSHTLPGHPDKMLVRASKRISAYDIVLPTVIKKKGEILTAVNHFWVTKLSPFFKTDLVTCGAGIDEYLPEHMRSRPELQNCSTVVQRYRSPDDEDIGRYYLTGSGFKDYTKMGYVCGHRLPPGLIDGSPLPTPLYTPSTKAKAGHDVNISVYDAIKRLGSEHEHMVLMIGGMMAQHAMTRGIIMADFKCEICGDVLIDEKGTPDCCRFWELAAWKKAHAKGKLPPSLDKQYIRDECKRLGIDKLDPENPEDLARVSQMVFPDDVRNMTTLLYRYIFWRLAGMKLEVYQHDHMGIDVQPPKPRIEILIGSESDLPQIEAGLEWLVGKAEANVSILSCHRNFRELPETTLNKLAKADLVVAGAGKAAALAGVSKGALFAIGRPDITVIGVGFKGETEEDDTAAKLSIKCLPGQPVELDSNGNAYFGAEGFLKACQAAVNDEFLPKNIEPKPAQFDIKKIS